VQAVVRLATIVAWAFAVLWPCASFALTIDSPTTSWTPVTYAGLVPDYFNDEQTGDIESDIVGDSLNPAVYTQFDDNGTPGDNSDDILAFRVRIGATKAPLGFSRFVAVGLDANQDGSLDLFIGVDNGGGDDHIEIYNAGTGQNISPSTTSIESFDPARRYAYDPDLFPNYDDYYNWSAIDIILDPAATSFDLDGDTNTDHFVSWAVPFQDVINGLAAAGISGFDENSPVSYVAGTSTQPNALNQDLGGPPKGGTTSSDTWAVLGAMSDTTRIAPTPEPNSFALFALGILGLTALRRRGLV
jgi:hypothetical protein